jgi:fumarate hydratase class II
METAGMDAKVRHHDSRDEVAPEENGEWTTSPLVIWQTGSGTQSNMN